MEGEVGEGLAGLGECSNIPLVGRVSSAHRPSPTAAGVAMVLRIFLGRWRGRPVGPEIVCEVIDILEGPFEIKDESSTKQGWMIPAKSGSLRSARRNTK